MSAGGPTQSQARDQRVDRFLQVVNGRPQTPCLGVISGSAAVSNASTGTSFTLAPGTFLALQADGPCYLGSAATSALAIAAVTGSSATAGGFKYDTNYETTWYWLLGPGEAFLAMLPVSGTVNLKVFLQT